jgi:acetyltransferase-like isoleucine patch superfamily enzyme
MARFSTHLIARLLIAARRMSFAVRFFGRRIDVKPSSWVSSRSTLRVCGGGSITIGRNCEIHPMSMLLTYGGDIRIGDNCSVNPFTIIYGHGGVHIGDGVRIAAHTVIIPANHNISSDGTPIYLSGYTAKGIAVGDHVWIGAGARILDGVSIGSNAVIGAGSVVTRSVPENAVAVGNPARVIKRRDCAQA